MANPIIFCVFVVEWKKKSVFFYHSFVRLDLKVVSRRWCEGCLRLFEALFKTNWWGGGIKETPTFSNWCKGVRRVWNVSFAAVCILRWWMGQVGGEGGAVGLVVGCSCRLWPWPWNRKRKLRYLTWYPYIAAHCGRAPVCKVQSSTLAAWQRLA